jgi:hypothetical protein
MSLQVYFKNEWDRKDNLGSLREIQFETGCLRSNKEMDLGNLLFLTGYHSPSKCLHIPFLQTLGKVDPLLGRHL